LAADAVVIVDGLTIAYGGRLPDSKRRTVSIKVSDEDLKIIDMAAAAMRVSRSEFIRSAALEKAAKILEASQKRENNKNPGP